MELKVLIKNLRILRGLTQEDMAKRLKVNRYTYMKYENNPKQMQVGMLEAICKELHCSIEDILIP